MGVKQREGNEKAKADDASNGGVSMVVVMPRNKSAELEETVVEAIKESSASLTICSASYQGVYVGKIRNFTTLNNLLQEKNITGLAIKSGLFKIGDQKFHLVAYPRVLVVRDGNIGAKLKFDVSTMNDFVKNIEVPPKLGLVHQKSFERIVGKAYSFNPDLSGDPVWFMKLSRMLEPDEGYVIEGSAVFICQIQHHGPCDKVSTEIAEFTEVISSEKEDDIFGSILKRADSSVSQPIEEVFSRDAAWIQSTMNEVCSYLESIVAKDFLSVVRNSFGCDLDRVADSLSPLINSTKVSQQLIIDLLLNLLVGCCEAEYVRKLEDSDIPEKDVAHPPSETFGIALLKMNHFHDLKLGKTKVFLRAGQIEVLDSQRAEVLVRLDTAAKCIRGRLRTYVARRDFLSTRVAAVSLQACCRGYLARKRYSEKREASSAISIQKYVRRWLLVDAYTKLRFSTLLIQSSIRGFLARQSFTQRNEHKAAMLIQSHWRMCKVRSAFRHRQVNIIAIQCLWRQKLAKRELWRLKKIGWIQFGRNIFIASSTAACSVSQ